MDICLQTSISIWLNYMQVSLCESIFVFVNLYLSLWIYICHCSYHILWLYFLAGSNWKDKPVEQWTADEVTLWICSLMNYQPASPFDSSYCPTVNVAAYLNLTGAELVRLSSPEIQARDPQSGAFVFLSLQNHLNQANVLYNISSTVLPSYTHMVSQASRSSICIASTNLVFSQFLIYPLN